MKNKSATMNKTFNVQGWVIGLAVAVMFPQPAARAGQAPVNLGTAGNYVILSESGISTSPPSTVTGNVGVSPISATAISGFSLVLDSSGAFSTSYQVAGKVYAADYAVPTPTNLATAVSDMQTAYNDAAGRPSEVGNVAGDISGQTLPPGIYNSSSSLAIAAGDLTLDATNDPNAVWIFQIASTLTTGANSRVILTNGATAANVFWQVGSSATLDTATHFQGTIMAQAAITLLTGASIHGRLLAQTAVTLEGNTVTVVPAPPSFASIQRAANGTVTLVISNTPNLALTLQTSTNLTNWTTLATPTPAATPCTYIDSTAAGAPLRFYWAFYP
jgi:hypothetical protein